MAKPKDREIADAIALGDRLLKAGDMRRAAIQFVEVAGLHAKRGDPLAAMAHLGLAHRTDRTNADALHGLVHMCCELELYAEAASHAKRLVDTILVPMARDGAVGAALERLRLVEADARGAPDVRVVLLAAIAELDPDDVATTRDVARLWLSDHPERSAAAAERCLRRNPDDIDALETLGEAFRKLGEPEKARAVLGRVVAACERSGDAKRLAAARAALASIA